MYMRLVQIRIKPQELVRVQEMYHTEIIPVLQQVPGCLYAALIQSTHNEDECVSMTLWESPEHANEYETSGVFGQLVDKLRPYLAESAEWRVQLSKDFNLEYVPVPEEPVVRAFNVAAQKGLPETPKHLWLRIVSLKIRPGLSDEFEEIYRNAILPVLETVKGCRYVFLTQGTGSQSEFLSITLWDSKQDAQQYEQGGRYEELLGKVKHTLSELYRWKMELGKTVSGVATSEDVIAEHFSIMLGKSF